MDFIRPLPNIIRGAVFLESPSTSGVLFLVMFFLIGLVCFGLSFRCYSSSDDTPVGIRVISGLLAAAWNVIYLGYYFVTVHIMGMSCEA